MDLNFFNNNALGYSPAVDTDAFGLNGCGLRQYNQSIEVDQDAGNLGEFPWADVITAAGSAAGSLISARNQSRSNGGPSPQVSLQLQQMAAQAEAQRKQQALQRNLLIGAGIILLLVIVFIIARRK